MTVPIPEPPPSAAAVADVMPHRTTVRRCPTSGLWMVTCEDCEKSGVTPYDLLPKSSYRSAADLPMIYRHPRAATAAEGCTVGYLTCDAACTSARRHTATRQPRRYGSGWALLETVGRP